MNVCTPGNTIGYYAPTSSGAYGTPTTWNVTSTETHNVHTANIDAVDVQANHGSFTTLTVNGEDISGKFDDVVDKTQYMTVGGGQTTFTSKVVVPSFEISGGSFEVASIKGTTVTATNVLTPDEFTSMKIGSAAKNMISLAPGSGYVGINTASSSYPLDITGTTRVSAPSTQTGTYQTVRAFVPNLTASASNEAQIMFGVSSSTRRCGVLAYNYNDSVGTTTNTNKISLYNQGTTTPRLDMDSNNITITGKLKVNGCTTDRLTSTVAFTSMSGSAVSLDIPAGCTSFRLSFFDVTLNAYTGSPVSSLKFETANGIDSVSNTYDRVTCQGDTGLRRGNTAGMPIWDAVIWSSGTTHQISGCIDFEMMGTLNNRQAWTVNGSSSNRSNHYNYYSGVILMDSSRTGQLTRIHWLLDQVSPAATFAGGYVNLCYDA